MRTAQEEILHFDDRWFRIIGTILIGFFVPAVFFNLPLSHPEYLMQALVSILYTAIYWALNKQIIMYLHYKFPKFEDVFKRLIWQTAATFSFTIFTCGLMNLVVEGVMMNVFQINLTKLQTHGQIYAASLISLALVTAIYESAYFFQRLKITLVQKEQLEKANTRSQLESLRNQVNPHFLFNSLNTLVYLIPENPEKAVRFVEKMAKVYRYILETRDRDKVPLQEELDFLQSYIFLLKERFGENLQCNIRVDKAFMDDEIVPLSLQMLFENAIKHNVVSAQRPLTISAAVLNDRLTVTNNLQKKNQVTDSTGFGLNNIRDRYEILTGKNIEIMMGSDNFSVSLPLIKTNKKVKIS